MRALAAFRRARFDDWRAMTDRRSEITYKVWLAIDGFVQAWRKTPHRWWYEADVACELKRRIELSLGADLSRVPIDDVQGPVCTCANGSRVRIDLPVYKKQAKVFRRADLVVCDDDPNRAHLLVCEIKTGSTSRDSNDIAKIRRWLRGPNPCALAGCVIDLKIPRKTVVAEWSGPQVDGSIRIYKVQACPPA